MDLNISIKRNTEHIITEAGGYVVTLDRSHPLVQMSELLSDRDGFLVAYHRDVLVVIRALLASGKSLDEVMTFMNGPDSFVKISQSEPSEVSA